MPSKTAVVRDGTTAADGLDGRTRESIGLVRVELGNGVVRDPSWAKGGHAVPSSYRHAVPDHAAAQGDKDAGPANSRHEIVGDDARQSDDDACATDIEHHVGPHPAAQQLDTGGADLDHAELFDHATVGEGEIDARLKVGDRAVAKGDREPGVLVPHPGPGAVSGYRVPSEIDFDPTGGHHQAVPIGSGRRFGS